ncbi:hypothetical protein [Gordonia caeni]|uniref:Uncharacterized protein n=1 Tax=Gordonia caeni TaxID=1007097 RepID=A0ABP7PBF0_9ACTN
MSAHSVVAEGLASHRVPFPGVIANFALAALSKAGYAVVKLPEAVRNRRGEPEWHSGLAKIGLNQNGVFWTGTFQPAPSDVEEFAAALLAAERHRVAEAVDHD